MTSNQQRWIVKNHFKKHHKIEFTDEQVEDMMDIFHDERRQSIFNVGMYRFINMFIAMIVMILWLFIDADKWFWLIVWIAFGVYNFWHSIVNYIQFKAVKMPNQKNDHKNRKAVDFDVKSN